MHRLFTLGPNTHANTSHFRQSVIVKTIKEIKLANGEAKSIPYCIKVSQRQVVQLYVPVVLRARDDNCSTIAKTNLGSSHLSHAHEIIFISSDHPYLRGCSQL